MAVTKKKKKKQIPKNKVKKTKKKIVSKSHPLAQLPATNPDSDDIIVQEDDEWEESGIDYEIDETDLEEISDSTFLPSYESDNIQVGQDSGFFPNSELEVPENISVPDPVSSDYYPGPDGSYRVSVYVNFDEVFRASNYEVRITE